MIIRVCKNGIKLVNDHLCKVWVWEKDFFNIFSLGSMFIMPCSGHHLGFQINTWNIRGRRGRDRMVVGFTTTYAISAYHHWCCEFESRSGRHVQHYVIKCVSDRSVVFSGCSSFLHKTDRHDIIEILLKVALNTIKQTNKHET
jgi:hypothetical protein